MAWYFFKAHPPVCSPHIHSDERNNIDGVDHFLLSQVQGWKIKLSSKPGVQYGVHSSSNPEILVQAKGGAAHGSCGSGYFPCAEGLWISGINCQGCLEAQVMFTAAGFSHGMLQADVWRVISCGFFWQMSGTKSGLTNSTANVIRTKQGRCVWLQTDEETQKHSNGRKVDHELGHEQSFHEESVEEPLTN